MNRFIRVRSQNISVTVESSWLIHVPVKLCWLDKPTQSTMN